MPWKPNMSVEQRRRLNESRRRSYARKRAREGKPCVHKKPTPKSPLVCEETQEAPPITNLDLVAQFLERIDEEG